MSKIPFTKPATTYQEQIDLLQERGMILPDKDEALFYLQHVNYYRLSAYWLPFEIDHRTHTFKEGTTFEIVLELYNFDRELRLLIMDAIERIEISMRANWTYHMAHNHSKHSHLDEKLASDIKLYKQNLSSMEKEVNRSKKDEVFVHHAINKYEEQLPAIWVVSEVISLGLLSKFYGNLKPRPTRRSIAGVYNIDKDVLGSWLHHLTHVRNICAHHSRLWNREFVTTPNKPKNKPKGLAEEFQSNSRKLYNTLVILLHFMDIISPKHTWRSKMVQLLSNPRVSLKSMGFPENWQTCKIWQEIIA